MEKKHNKVMTIIWLLLSHRLPMQVSAALYKGGCFVPAPGNSSICFTAASVEECAIKCENIKNNICEVFRFYPESHQCVVARMENTAQCCSQPEDGGNSFKKVIQNEKPIDDKGIPEVLGGVVKVGEYLHTLPYHVSYMAVTSTGEVVLPQGVGGTEIRVYSRNFTSYRNLVFPVFANVGQPRGITRRGKMLLIVDGTKRCVHVMSEEGVYSHKFNLTAISPWGISTTGSTAFISTSWLLVINKLYRVELTEDNQKISEEEQIPPNAQLSLVHPTHIVPNGNIIAIAHLVVRGMTLLSIYDTCSKEAVSISMLGGVPVGAQDVMVDSFGRFLFADGINNRISVVTPTGDLVKHYVTSAEGLTCAERLTAFTAYDGKLFVMCKDGPIHVFQML